MLEIEEVKMRETVRINVSRDELMAAFRETLELMVQMYEEGRLLTFEQKVHITGVIFFEVVATAICEARETAAGQTSLVFDQELKEGIAKLPAADRERMYLAIQELSRTKSCHQKNRVRFLLEECKKSPHGCNRNGQNV